MTKCVTVLRPVPGRDSSANAAPIMVTAAAHSPLGGRLCPRQRPCAHLDLVCSWLPVPVQDGYLLQLPELREGRAHVLFVFLFTAPASQAG